MPTIKSIESRVRRKAKREGFIVQKSRVRFPNSDDFGEYKLLDGTSGYAVLGYKFEASLEEIEDYLDSPA